MRYKNILLGKLRYLILFLVTMQSLLFALVAIFLTGVQYQESSWQNYNQNSDTLTIYLQRLSEEQSQSVLQYFWERDDLSIWTKRSVIGYSDQGPSKLYLDIIGSPKGFSDIVNKDKLIVSNKQIEDLLSQTENDKTIGLDTGSENMLYELPNLLFTTPMVIDRIDYVFEQIQTMSGSYFINGLNDSQSKDAFLSTLSNVTGISVEELTTEEFGSSIDYGIMPIVLGTSISVIALVLLFLYLISVLQSFKFFGTLILLGWDRKHLCITLFKESVLFSVYITPISALMIWILSGWSFFGLSSILPIFAGASVSILLLSLIMVLPSLIIYFVSPLSAIHKRLPMRFLLVISLSFYMLISSLLIAVGHALDAPMDWFVDNIKVAREWKNVENMYVISSFIEGDDIGTYAGTTSSLEQSMYRFYNRISDIPGVYLAHGTYLDEEILKAYHRLYQNVPSKPFWELTYSYNYLLDLGVDINNEELAEIKSGTRLYLIPNSLNEDEIEKMKGYLQESVTVNPEDISTKFTENQRFLFKIYQPSKPLLTWSESFSNGLTSQNPVIFVAAPENLYFMESANLIISGYNGILKIRDKDTMNQVQSILDNEFPDLLDNHIQFKTVKNYINGLQKDLGYTFYLFGIVIAIILVILIAVFSSLVLTYRFLFEEKLYVQYFIGFSPWKRYVGVVSLILGVSMIELLVSIFIRSRLGIVLTISTFILQMLLLYFYIFHKENDNILQSFKG